MKKKYNYDEENDILYADWGKPQVGYSQEIATGIYIRLSTKDEPIGVTIMDYKKKLTRS